MSLSRRRMLQGTAALALRRARPYRLSPRIKPVVPIVFVHGDSDAAAIWQTTIWRFESNGYPRDRLFPISFTDPQARDDDTASLKPNRSSTEDQIRESDGLHRRRQDEDRRGEGRDRRGIARRLFDPRICRRQSGECLPCGARRHPEPRRLRHRCAARQRVQRARRVSDEARRW